MRQSKNKQAIDTPVEAAAKSTIQTVGETCPFSIGQSYFIRTVTYHLVGRVKSIIGTHLILESASWVADSGRFTQAIQNGVLGEVEPVGDVFVNLASYTDAFPWVHPLPVTQK